METPKVKTLEYYDWDDVKPYVYNSGLNPEQLYNRLCEDGCIHNDSYISVYLNEDDSVEKFLIEFFGTDSPIILFSW